MPCNQNCNQGRNCDCKKDSSVDRATVVVATLLLVAVVSVVSMGFGVYKLLNGNKGQECAVNVKFKDSSATYIGQSV
jgi:predicted thioesterase